MGLRDHFHPPLSERRHWESFHGYWAAAIGELLNDRLLSGDYYAEIQVHVGSRVEIDVATFDEARGSAVNVREGSGGVATAPARAWSPPAPAKVMPAIFPDSLEVLVMSSEAGPTLVSAIELVSPGNKDRPEYRRAFAAKCASYLQQGIGLMIVDIVTGRGANLHNELVDLLGTGAEYRTADGPLYTASYHPARRQEGDRIELWTAELKVGSPLPLMPLPLDKGLFVPLDLEGTYEEACRRSRLP